MGPKLIEESELRVCQGSDSGDKRKSLRLTCGIDNYVYMEEYLKNYRLEYRIYFNADCGKI